MSFDEHIRQTKNKGGLLSDCSPNNIHKGSHKLVDANRGSIVQFEYPGQLISPSPGCTGCFKFWCAPL